MRGQLYSVYFLLFLCVLCVLLQATAPLQLPVFAMARGTAIATQGRSYLGRASYQRAICTRSVSLSWVRLPGGMIFSCTTWE